MRMLWAVPLCAVMVALMTAHAWGHGDGRVSHIPGMTKEQMEKENSKLRELLEAQVHENAALRQLVERQAPETPTMRGRRSSASRKRRQSPPPAFSARGTNELFSLTLAEDLARVRSSVLEKVGLEAPDNGRRLRRTTTPALTSGRTSAFLTSLEKNSVGT